MFVVLNHPVADALLWETETHITKFQWLKRIQLELIPASLGDTPREEAEEEGGCDSPSWTITCAL